MVGRATKIGDVQALLLSELLGRSQNGPPNGQRREQTVFWWKGRPFLLYQRQSYFSVARNLGMAAIRVSLWLSKALCRPIMKPVRPVDALRYGAVSHL